MNYSIKHPENEGGMNSRIRRLRQQNFDTPTTLSIERALIETEFYKKYYGTMPTPVLRARNFYENDYSFFYNNLKENVATRIAAYKANN